MDTFQEVLSTLGFVIRAIGFLLLGFGVARFTLDAYYKAVWQVQAALALGFFGTVAIVWPREGFSTAHFVPQLGILVGCLGWAAGTIYFRNAQKALDILAFTGLQMLAGGAMLTAIGLGLGEQHQWNWSAPGMLAMAYLTVFSSCLAYTAYAWLTQHTTPARVATYGYVNPALATLLGGWLLHEQLTGVMLAGMAVILAGVVLVNWPDEVSAPESPG